MSLSWLVILFVWVYAVEATMRMVLPKNLKQCEKVTLTWENGEEPLTMRFGDTVTNHVYNTIEEFPRLTGHAMDWVVDMDVGDFFYINLTDRTGAWSQTPEHEPIVIHPGNSDCMRGTNVPAPPIITTKEQVVTSTRTVDVTSTPTTSSSTTSSSSSSSTTSSSSSAASSTSSTSSTSAGSTRLSSSSPIPSTSASVSASATPSPLTLGGFIPVSSQDTADSTNTQDPTSEATSTSTPNPTSGASTKRKSNLVVIIPVVVAVIVIFAIAIIGIWLIRRRRRQLRLRRSQASFATKPEFKPPTEETGNARPFTVLPDIIPSPVATVGSSAAGTDILDDPASLYSATTPPVETSGLTTQPETTGAAAQLRSAAPAAGSSDEKSVGEIEQIIKDMRDKINRLERAEELRLEEDEQRRLEAELRILHERRISVFSSNDSMTSPPSYRG